MKDSGRNVACQAGQLFIGLKLHTGFELLGLVSRQSALADDAARDAQGICCYFSVLLGAEVIGRNGGRVFKARAFDADGAAAGRCQVADTGCECIEAVKRLSECIKRQRLDVVLDVWISLRGVRPGKGAKLRRCHAHGAGTFEQILKPNAGLAQPGAGQRVERGIGCASDFVNRTNLQMVLQVSAHTRQVFHNGYAVLLQQRTRANAGKLQKLRRANGTCTQNNFTNQAALPGRVARGHHVDKVKACPYLHAGAALTTVWLLFNDQFADLGLVPQLKIGAGVAGRAQESLGRVPAPAILLVDFKITHALVVAPIEIVCGRNASLDCGL